jgi:hypothetical protein
MAKTKQLKSLQAKLGKLEAKKEHLVKTKEFAKGVARKKAIGKTEPSLSRYYGQAVLDTMHTPTVTTTRIVTVDPVDSLVFEVKYDKTSGILHVIGDSGNKELAPILNNYTISVANKLLGTSLNKTLYMGQTWMPKSKLKRKIQEFPVIAECNDKKTDIRFFSNRLSIPKPWLKEVDKLEKLCPGINPKYAEKLSDNRYHVIAFDSMGKIRAFAAIDFYDRDKLFVSLICSNMKGLGRKVMHFIEDTAKKLPQFKKVRYVVLDSVDAAKGFYKKLGYVTVKPKDQGTLMHKRLR